MVNQESFGLQWNRRFFPFGFIYRHGMDLKRGAHFLELIPLFLPPILIAKDGV